MAGVPHAPLARGNCSYALRGNLGKNRSERFEPPLMLRHTLSNVNAVARARAVVPIVDEEAKHRDDHNCAAEDKGKDGRAADTTGTVCHLLLHAKVIVEQTELAARRFPAVPPFHRGGTNVVAGRSAQIAPVPRRAALSYRRHKCRFRLLRTNRAGSG